MRVTGLDLSLTSTGLVHVVDGAYAGHLNPKTSAPKPMLGKKMASLEDRQGRLYGIANAIVDESAGADLIVVEAPSFGSSGGAAHDRSGLWWIILNALMHDGHPVAQVSPQGRAKYGTGDGRSKKAVVLAAVRESYTDWFGKRIPNDDVADAVLLASMGARRLDMPTESWELGDKNLEAMEGVLWPAP